MDGFLDDLSYSLPLLVGFDLVELDQGGRLSAMGGVGPLVIVKGNPSANASLGMRVSFPSVQIDAFILPGPPKAFDEDVVDAAPFPVHGDPGADPFQPVGPSEGRELRALVAVHDLGRPEAMARLVQSFDAEVHFQRVRDAPSQHLAGGPVHDGNQVEEAPPHWQVGFLIDHLRSLILSRVSATCKVLFEFIPFGASSRHPRLRRPEGDICDACGSHVDRSGLIECLPLWSVRQLFAGAACRGARLISGPFCFEFGAIYPDSMHDHG